MKAAWIRNFWTKTVAFLLAAALVPVILTYVVGLAYSYGGMGRDFYTSDLCLTAVGKRRGRSATTISPWKAETMSSTRSTPRETATATFASV